MRSAARLVIDTHAHITTLYAPAGKKSQELAKQGIWNGLNGEVVPFDNSPMCLYDMQRYGIDMCLLKPSVIGTTNEAQAALVDKYPDKFRAFCSDQKLKIKCWRGEAEWKLNDAADEVEAALKTGKYIGIGEFMPKNPKGNPFYTFEERLNEYRTFAELAKKYKVTIDFHDWAGYPFDSYLILSRIAAEFPDVPVIFCHAGASIGSYVYGGDIIRKALAVAGRAKNIYLETGNWATEFFEMALKDPNIGPTQLIWGGDYGHVPQYIVANPGGSPSHYSSMFKRWPSIPHYHIDWWGFALYQIDKVREFVTQDEINLILGGNAARIWRLPVPYERMFLSGRPDVFGIDWEKSVPYVSKDQVMHPD
jgi:predicted TIM-barrel fold metal-dependent hydrolase